MSLFNRKKKALKNLQKLEEYDRMNAWRTVPVPDTHVATVTYEPGLPDTIYVNCPVDNLVSDSSSHSHSYSGGDYSSTSSHSDSGSSYDSGSCDSGGGGGSD